jgi:hypothetical protein
MSIYLHTTYFPTFDNNNLAIVRTSEFGDIIKLFNARFTELRRYSTNNDDLLCFCCQLKACWFAEQITATATVLHWTVTCSIYAWHYKCMKNCIHDPKHMPKLWFKLYMYDTRFYNIRSCMASAASIPSDKSSLRFTVSLFMPHWGAISLTSGEVNKVSVSTFNKFQLSFGFLG